MYRYRKYRYRKYRYRKYRYRKYRYMKYRYWKYRPYPKSHFTELFRRVVAWRFKKLIKFE